MAKRKKPATAGELAVARVYDCRVVDVRAVEDWRLLAASIDRGRARALARARREGREEVRADVLAHARRLCENLSGCVSGVAEGWRQCIVCFEGAAKR